MLSRFLKLFVAFFYFFLMNFPAQGQLRQISTSKVSQLRVKGNRCFDSTWTFSTVCPLGQRRLNVIFFFTFFDKINKTVRLVGRVQTLDKVSSTGLTGIEIFKGQLKDQKLKNRTKLGETTDGKEYITNDGFFDITAKIGSEESLFFLRRIYFVEEFKISNLLK
jgi:hypothetical protein